MNFLPAPEVDRYQHLWTVASRRNVDGLRWLERLAARRPDVPQLENLRKRRENWLARDAAGTWLGAIWKRLHYDRTGRDYERAAALVSGLHDRLEAAEEERRERREREHYGPGAVPRAYWSVRYWSLANERIPQGPDRLARHLAAKLGEVSDG